MQLELQAPIEQLKGAQFMGMPLAMHVPAPSQLCGCRLLPLHIPPQLVPAG